jgi:hypothetical protein
VTAVNCGLCPWQAALGHILVNPFISEGPPEEIPQWITAALPPDGG